MHPPGHLDILVGHPHAHGSHTSALSLTIPYMPLRLLDHLLVLRNDRFLTLRTDRFSRPAQELIRYLRRKRLSLHDFVYQMLGLSVLPPASRRRRVRSADGSSSIVLPPLLQEHTRGMPRVVLKYLSRSLAHFGKRVISHIFPEPWGGDSVVESRGSLSLKNNGEYDTIHVALSTNLLAVRINLH